MLIIVMHNKMEYLNALDSLAHREGITATNIIKRQGLSFSFKGHQANFLFQRGSISEQFDKAFIAVVNPLESKRLFELLQNSDDLSTQSLNSEGFICTVPFDKIKNLSFDSSFLRHIRSENNISRILKVPRIQLDLNADSPEEAISLTAEPMKKADEITDFSKFLRDVLAREAVAPTAIGDGVAIPHARSISVRKLVISVGRFEQGVDWGTPDNRPVKLLFLIGSPSVKGARLTEYLTTLAHLTKYLNDEGFRHALLDSSTPEKVINIFQGIEQGLPEGGCPGCR